ncbi:hypothetical protein Tco_0428178 [Tanacetum coccineum]
MLREMPHPLHFTYYDPSLDPEDQTRGRKKGQKSKEDDDERTLRRIPIDYPTDGGDDGDDEIDIDEDERMTNMDIELPHSAASTTESPWSSSPPQIPFPLSPPSPSTSHSLPLPPPFILSLTRPDAPPPLPTSAPTSFPPLLLPSDRQREDRPEVNLPPSYGTSIALGPMYRQVRRDPERYVGYGITDAWDEIVETLQGAPVSTDTELGAHMREFESMVRRDTDEIYTRLDDEQGQRQLLAGRVNMLFRDRRAHAHTRQLMETEAGMSREAWGRAMDASDLAHGGVISLRTTVHAQMAEIAELQSADRRRQRAMSDLLETDRRRREEMRELRAADRTRQQQIIQTLTAVQTLQRETIPLQGLVTTLQGQVTALQGQVMTLQGQVTVLQGQQGPAGGPAQPELPEDTGSKNGTKASYKVNAGQATRSTRAPPTPNETTTTVTEAQLQALIDQGVAAAMAEAEASRARNGYNSNGSGPRPAQTARECSYSEFLKCKPLDFKGTEGVVGLTRC